MAARTTTLFLLPLMLGIALASSTASADQIRGPFVGPTAVGYPTATLDSLPLNNARVAPVYMRPRANPLAHPPAGGSRGSPGRPVTSTITAAPAPAVESGANRATPGTIHNFEGQGNDTCFCTPPDTVGDVGPNHYVQMVNATGIAIYNKSGSLLPGYPKNLSSLFASGNCSLSDRGDPVVLYDGLANRWLLAQISAGNGMCIAISQTGNPTGAYFGYEFLTPEFPDYPKFGVWPDGYYMSTNDEGVPTYTAYAFNRKRMLAGRPSSFIRFDGVSNFMLPSDVDGSRPPPPGSPNYFYTFKDNAFHRVAADRLEIREFHADFAAPANSTFRLTGSINITPFKYTVCGAFVFDCIPQRGTAQKLDPVSEWPMFRFPYRNFRTHESLAGTFTVEGATRDTAAVYWFELRKLGGGWGLHQQGKIDSNDGVSRWIGSIAMDSAGNLALGYSVSSASMFPAIRYAVHRIIDAPGTMQREATLRRGGGSQTGSNRWGDYSAMTIDPADDATFWYTNQYYSADTLNDWDTRIGTFRILNTAPFASAGANDGFIAELSETAGSGGSLNSTSDLLRVGDDAADRQYLSIVDFDTSALPDAAVITGAVLRLEKAGAVVGTDPFTTHGNIRADIRHGGFSHDKLLQVQDFQANASLANATVLHPRLWGNLRAAALVHINRSGRTQFRLRFAKDDNDDQAADALKMYSGEAAVSRRPVLEVTYFLP